MLAPKNRGKKSKDLQKVNQKKQINMLWVVTTLIAASAFFSSADSFVRSG
jgi:beta-lactamase regulating signal transducer with metallopeptidase domain